MNILHITPYFYPEVSVGGTARALFDQSGELVKRGHKVTVWTTDLGVNGRMNRFPTEKVTGIRGIKTIFFRNLSNDFAYRYHLFLPYSFLRTINKHLKDFDIIHFHEIYTPMHLYGGMIARKLHIPYIITPHGTANLSESEGRVGRKKIFYLLGGKQFLEGARKIISLNALEKSSIEKFGIPGDKIEIIPNALEIGKVKKVKTTGFKKMYGILESGKILLFMGRIQKKKGIELLIRAFAKLSNFFNIFLVIAGPIEEEDYYHYLKKMVFDLELEKKIIWTGNLEDEEKNDALISSDIFLLTSYSEGHPVTVLEAASYGLPLIVTDRCGYTEIERYDAGYSVKPEAKEISGAIEKMLKIKDFKSKFGKSAYNMVSKEYSLDKITTRLLSVYSDKG